MTLNVWENARSLAIYILTVTVVVNIFDIPASYAVVAVTIGIVVIVRVIDVYDAYKEHKRAKVQDAQTHPEELSDPLNDSDRPS